MISCPNCGCDSVRSNGGKYETREGTKKRWYCPDCENTFVTLVTQPITKQSSSNKSLLITCMVNGVDYNQGFLDTLETYAELNKCDLFIIPTRYKRPEEAYNPEYPEYLRKYLVEENIIYSDYKLQILGALKLSASLENPLSGLDPLTKGFTTIIGHPQVQLRTMPRVHEEYPPILTTTGSVSEKPYKNTKPGSKAAFNHSYSAVVVEFDEVENEKIVHLRHLNFDDSTNGFYDINTFYYPGGSEVAGEEGSAIALITGDEHGIYADKTVEQATYTNEYSIVNITKPDMIIRHDIFDCYSVSHHDKNDFLTRYKKSITQKNILEDELSDTVDYLERTTPDWCVSYIISSNHNEHLTRWLNECEPKKEPWNAKLYHLMMYFVLEIIESNNEIPDPFEIYAKSFKHIDQSKFQFVKRNDELKVSGITLSSHGDIGNNGSRGSRDQFALLPEKSIIGHSHSPGIEKGCYQVGTSSNLRLDYNKGASSWHHCHCLIHRNGKRQLIFITKGKFRK